MPAAKLTKFGRRYLGEGSSEPEKILQVAMGELMYSTTHNGDLWPTWGAKILNGVK